jgi:hypothetical protein
MVGQPPIGTPLSLPYPEKNGCNPNHRQSSGRFTSSFRTGLNGFQLSPFGAHDRGPREDSPAFVSA